MQVVLNPINSLINSFEPSLNRLTALFKSLLETLTSCWGNRKAARIETPTETAEKVDITFKKTIEIPATEKVDITSKEAVLEKKSFHESRFPKALWDLAAGVEQNDLTFIETVEKSLSDSDKLELRAQINKKNKNEFIAFLRKLDNFDDRLNTLKSLLNKIRLGQTTREELKLAVREIREYFINRSSNFTKNTGQEKGGIVEPFVGEFREPLFGPYPSTSDIYELKEGRLINHTYENKGRTKISAWVAGFTFQEGGHAVAYVYTKEGFVKFDNLNANNTLYSNEKISELLLSVPQDVLTLLKFPLNENTNLIPDAKSWITPTWEKNNCFAAASLIFLATCQHYQKDE